MTRTCEDITIVDRTLPWQEWTYITCGEPAEHEHVIYGPGIVHYCGEHCPNDYCLHESHEENQ